MDRWKENSGEFAKTLIGVQLPRTMRSRVKFCSKNQWVRTKRVFSGSSIKHKGFKTIVKVGGGIGAAALTGWLLFAKFAGNTGKEVVSHTIKEEINTKILQLSKRQNDYLPKTNLKFVDR